MTTTPNTTASGAADDSLLLCASDLQHSAIYDNPHEMVDCVRAVADRITALAASAPVAPTLSPEFMHEIREACYEAAPVAPAPMHAVPNLTLEPEMRAAMQAVFDAESVPVRPAPLQQGEYLPLPKRRRRFLCTKCGSEQCKDGTENKPHPPCNKCNYLGFAEDCDFNDEEMRAYVDADRAARGAAQVAPAPVAEDAANWHWLASYLVGPRTDLDDEIVASESVNDLRKLVSAARAQAAQPEGGAK